MRYDNTLVDTVFQLYSYIQNFFQLHRSEFEWCLPIVTPEQQLRRDRLGKMAWRLLAKSNKNDDSTES